MEQDLKQDVEQDLKQELELDVINQIVRFLDDHKAEDIVAFDLRGIANIADCFIVATGANKPHLKAMHDGLQQLFKEAGFSGVQRAGVPDSGWMIVDYLGVMVHLFEHDLREYYNLEKLWLDAPRLALVEK